jgi:hypothetical protein
LRTLPYVRAWSQTYVQRFAVIGVHTPEFPFEHRVENVRLAAHQIRIDYPIGIDNDYVIWRAFDNQYWPARYFIDGRGRVRHQHFGEGAYEQSELMIQRLLAESGVAASDPGLMHVHSAGVEVPADWEDLRSRENYVGYQRSENFASPGRVKRDGSHAYALPSPFALNQWALAGEWAVGRQAIVSSVPAARIENRFHARSESGDRAVATGQSRKLFRVKIDGQSPGSAYGGVDVDEGGNGTIFDQRLYQLIRQPKPIVDRQFAIEFLDGGVEAYAFTFGQRRKYSESSIARFPSTDSHLTPPVAPVARGGPQFAKHIAAL